MLIGAIVGAVAGVSYGAYKDRYDDGSVNGSIGFGAYLGYGLLGAAFGGVLGYCIGTMLPAISSFCSSTFTIGGGMIVNAFGTAAVSTGITVSGTQILVGTAALTGIGVMIAKGSGPRIGHNQHEKQMWNEAMRKLGIEDKDLIRRLHEGIHKYAYAEKLKDLLKILRELLGKWGY